MTGEPEVRRYNGKTASELIFSPSPPVQLWRYHSYFLKYPGQYGWFVSFLNENPDLTIIEYPAASTGGVPEGLAAAAVATRSAREAVRVKIIMSSIDNTEYMLLGYEGIVVSAIQRSTVTDGVDGGNFDKLSAIWYAEGLPSPFSDIVNPTPLDDDPRFAKWLPRNMLWRELTIGELVATLSPAELQEEDGFWPSLDQARLYSLRDHVLRLTKQILQPQVNGRYDLIETIRHGPFGGGQRQRVIFIQGVVQQLSIEQQNELLEAFMYLPKGSIIAFGRDERWHDYCREFWEKFQLLASFQALPGNPLAFQKMSYAVRHGTHPPTPQHPSSLYPDAWPKRRPQRTDMALE